MDSTDARRQRLSIQHEKETVPVKAAFAMTASKSQGQTLTKMGIFLPTDFFSHNLIYVTQSHVGSKDNMKKLAPTGNMTGMNRCMYRVLCVVKYCMIKSLKYIPEKKFLKIEFIQFFFLNAHYLCS